MSWVIEEITTSTIGFVIAMVVLSVIIGVGLYGYWVYANHVTLENYLWPIAEVLPYKGEYFLAIVNTGNEPFYIEQIYLKGGAVLTPNQATNPNLNWCSVANTKLMHNQWWCGEVNQLPVAVRVCSAIDPRVCTVVPVHGWTTVTFSQPTQAAFGISNCPVLTSVSDPQGASWLVTWIAPGDSFVSGQVTKSTSYEWCIVPNYYPITINFQSTITNSPSGYACQISPQTAQVNYDGKPETQSFTVTCQQQQQPPPPPPPPPPPGGNKYAYVYTDVSAPSGVSWTVYLYFDGQLDATYQGSGSQSYGPAVFSSSGTVSYKVSGIPNTCSVSYSPSQSFSISPGNSYTETITITCQGQQPPPPPTTYGCLLTVSGQGSPSGAPTPSVSPSGTVFVSSGQTLSIKATAQLSSGGSSNWYEFDYWSDSFSGSGSLSETSSAPSGGNDISYWQYACPSGLTSNVTATATIIANYVWDYITLSGPTTVSPPSSGAEASIQYNLTWYVAPGSADQVSWSVSQLSGTQFKVSASLTYTEYGSQSSGGAYITTTVTCNTGEVRNLQVSGSSPSTYSVSGTSGSTTWTVYATWECAVNTGPPP